MELYVINEICKRELLWNHKHEHFYNPSHLIAAWKDVADVVGEDVEVVIATWIDLVDRFVKAQEIVRAVGDWKKCSFNYYNMMLFVENSKLLKLSTFAFPKPARRTRA